MWPKPRERLRKSSGKTIFSLCNVALWKYVEPVILSSDTSKPTIKHYVQQIDTIWIFCYKILFSSICLLLGEKVAVLSEFNISKLILKGNSFLQEGILKEQLSKASTAISSILKSNMKKRDSISYAFVLGKQIIQWSLLFFLRVQSCIHGSYTSI